MGERAGVLVTWQCQEQLAIHGRDKNGMSLNRGNVILRFQLREGMWKAIDMEGLACVTGLYFKTASAFSYTDTNTHSNICSYTEINRYIHTQTHKYNQRM